MGRGKEFRQKAVRHGKRVWKWFRIALGLFLGALALPDIPSEIAEWQRIITMVVTDPRVHAAAVWLSEAATIHNYWPVRLGLGLAGLALLFWGSRPIWRARRKASFLVRRIVTEQVWIDEETALRTLKESRWARIRQLESEPKKSIFDITPLALTRDPARDARGARFSHWCRMALKVFAEANPDAVREAEGKREYDEGKLKSYLVEKYDTDAIADFGEPY